MRIWALAFPLIAWVVLCVPAMAVEKTVFIISGTTWAVPSDFTSTNTWHCIGAGGKGGVATVNNTASAGGGSGGYSSVQNVNLTPSSTVNMAIGVANGGNGSGNDTSIRDNS